MRPPARAIDGSFVWAADGGAWVVWAAQPFSHAHAPRQARLDAHGRLRGLLLGLPADAALMSVCEPVQPPAVEARLTVDIESGAAWAAAARAASGRLTGGVFRRRWLIAARLPDPTRGRFGRRPGPQLGGAEVEAPRRDAQQLAARLGPLVSLRPATAGQLCWLYAHAIARGHPREPMYSPAWEPAEQRLSTLAMFDHTTFWESGRRDDHGRPRHHRYLRIDTPAGSSFQALGCAADMPRRFTYPGGGGECLWHLDRLPFPVDWTVRIRRVGNQAAQAKARRRHRELVGQIGEYDGEPSGAPASLGDAIAALADERAALAANRLEAELQCVLIFAVAAASPGELEERMAVLQALFEPAEYGIGRPTGGQLPLLRAMLPGSAVPPVGRDYTQHLLARDLAACAPLCGAPLGDPAGMLLGVSGDSGLRDPVFFDAAYGPRIDRSASLAAIGALGSGKSYLLKQLTWATVARGGRVVAVDRTDQGEYVRLAALTPGTSQVVAFGRSGPGVLDPLAVFPEGDRTRIAQGFLCLLARVGATSEEGVAIAEAVDTVAASPGGRLPLVLDALHVAGRADRASRLVARRLAAVARLPDAQVAFGDGDPLALSDADFVVFHLPGLDLPDRDLLANPALAGQLLPEQVLAHAVLYLVAAAARAVIFTDASRFGAALFDEAWALMASPHGERLLLDTIRDGRKHNAAVWVASQHPADLGDRLAALLGARFVFRHPGAAVESLALLGVDADAEHVELVQRGLETGECLFRDVAGRVGIVRLADAPLPHLHDAFNTTPTPAATTQPQPDPVPPGPPDNSDELPSERSPVAALLSRQEQRRRIHP